MERVTSVPSKQVTIAASPSPEIQPATIIHLPNVTVTQEEIDAKIAWFEQVDDVFHRDFLQVALVYRPLDTCDEKQLLAILSSFGTRKLHCLDLARPEETVPEGSYFVQSRTLYQTWRLYEDTYVAFHISTTQSNDDMCVLVKAWFLLEFDPYLTSAISDIFLWMLPLLEGISQSQCLHAFIIPPQHGKAFERLRVSVKDNIDIRGVGTSGSSRSYFNTYPAAETSAPAIQKLIDLGAIVVGKTGLSQFADAEDPTGDYIDYHCAFNPRGDGYRVSRR